METRKERWKSLKKPSRAGTALEGPPFALWFVFHHIVKIGVLTCRKDRTIVQFVKGDQEKPVIPWITGVT